MLEEGRLTFYREAVDLQRRLIQRGQRTFPYHSSYKSSCLKVHIYLEYHSACSLVEIKIPPSPASECVLPPEPKGGDRLTMQGGEGVGESKIERLEKKPIGLCLLCDSSLEPNQS